MVVTNIFSLARTSQKLPAIQLVSFTGLGVVSYCIYSASIGLTTQHFTSMGIAILGVIFVQWYVRSFSFYRRDNSQQIVNGQRLPKIELSRLDNQLIDYESFVGDKTLLVFFRANWCPFCMNQLKEVLAQTDRIKNAGVNVKFVSNQGIDHSTDLAKKLRLPKHFEILQDNDLKAARKLGIEDVGGSPTGLPGFPEDTVMATVIALDTNGKVIFGDEIDNYRVRPHPDSFLHVFER